MAHLCCQRKQPSAADAVPLPHAGKACKVSQSSVIPLISGEWIVSHVWMRSFGAVPTCSGWGSHMGRFRSLRMTIREGGRALIWEIRCMFWN